MTVNYLLIVSNPAGIDGRIAQTAFRPATGDMISTRPHDDVAQNMKWFGGPVGNTGTCGLLSWHTTHAPTGMNYTTLLGSPNPTQVRFRMSFAAASEAWPASLPGTQVTPPATWT
jgi:hypothetical protein